jgi:hypothetical protein
VRAWGRRRLLTTKLTTKPAAPAAAHAVDPFLSHVARWQVDRQFDLSALYLVARTANGPWR